MNETLTPARAVAAARAYLGVPWRHQGRGKTGLDCLGLLVCVARDLGLAPEDLPSYARIPSRFALRRALDAALPRAPAPGPGLIGLFDTEGRWPCHLGLFSERGMIHAHAPDRRVVEHGYTAPWPERLRAVYGWPVSGGL